jgi:hypothetical protein
MELRYGATGTRNLPSCRIYIASALNGPGLGCVYRYREPLHVPNDRMKLTRGCFQQWILAPTV